MNILVKVHINNEWDDSEITCAKIRLNDRDIKNIFRLAKKAGKNTIQEYDYTPDFGKSDLDLDNMYVNYWDMKKLEDVNEEEIKLANLSIFTSIEDVRIDVSQLNVDKTDFWWEGCFKNTDVRWSTGMIPLSLLPQELRPATKTTTPAADLNMTAEQMNAIHEKIAAGMNNGLNAREIVATFNRHITQAQLVRVIMEHIERDH